MVVKFRSPCCAAVEAAALVATAFAAVGMAPTVAVEAPSASQALALRRLGETFALHVLDARQLDAALRAPHRTLVNPLLLACPPRPNLGVPAASGSLDLTAQGQPHLMPVREIGWRSTDGDACLPFGSPVLGRDRGRPCLDADTRRHVLGFAAQLVAAHVLGVGRTAYANVSRLLVDVEFDRNLPGQVITHLAGLADEVGDDLRGTHHGRPVTHARRPVGGRGEGQATRRPRAEFGLRSLA